MATTTTQQITTRYPSTQSSQRQHFPAKPLGARAPTVNPARVVTAHDNAPFPRAASYTYLPHATDKPHYGDESGLLAITGVVDAEYLGREAESEEPVDISPPESSGYSTPDEALSLPPPPTKVPQARDIIAGLQKAPLVELLEKKQEVVKEDESQQKSEADCVQAKSKQDITVNESAVVEADGERGTGTRSSLSLSRPISGRAITAPSTTSAQRRPSVSKPFSKRFGRNSWYKSRPSTPTASRSPSPSKSDTVESNDTPTPCSPARPPKAIRRQSILRRKDPTKLTKAPKEAPVMSIGEQSPETSVVRRATLLGKKASRPVSGLFRLVTTDNGEFSLPPRSFTNASATDLPRSFSSERLSGVSPRHTSFDRTIPVPRLGSVDRTLGSPLPLPRKRDELWTVFRTLDADYTKFASKSVSLKANVIRNSLLPFLRQYATHPSNSGIRPEDLDRRANTLNKWWTGLNEMLEGRSNLSISGTDRPIILDGISGIMERPEWRQSPPYSPLAHRIVRPSLPASRSTSSLGSNMSEFLIESIHQNVRNMFIRNLSAQMSYVVEKMSQKNAAASLVTFCGKACAYAFMFVPGMADVLVRLWQVPLEPMRRVLNENGVGKFSQAPSAAYEVVSNFPHTLHELAFTSLMPYVRKLRTPPPASLVGMEHVNWQGHWIERWSGRDTDLFYVFVKYFHILAADFLSEKVSQQEKMHAPGFLVVHAQLLVNLDATVHRNARQAQHQPHDVQTALHAHSATPNLPCDDVLDKPDAVASALPTAPTNPARMMAENRLIMLIRDMFSDREGGHGVAADLFASSFNSILQAAARGTFLYDYAACYTLLDFLEEAMLIMARFENLKGTECKLIDLNFWREVFEKLIRSENTMTEIRLYAFLYSVWNTLAADAARKRILTLDLLLEPRIFESRFHHWCPMVRTYYMRLLCWRVARFDGELSSSEDQPISIDDRCILETLQMRLSGSWSFYQSLRVPDDTGTGWTLPTVTQPCLPVPGRRLIIVRTDKASLTNTFVSFDGILTTHKLGKQNERKRVEDMQGITGIHVEADKLPDSSELLSKASSLGGFFRKMVVSGARSPSPSLKTTQAPESATDPALNADPNQSRPSTSSAAETSSAAHSTRSTSVTTENSNTTSKLAAAGSQPTLSSKPTSAPSQKKSIQYRSLSFKFSLEPLPPGKPFAPPLRVQQPRLPVPAHTALQLSSSQSSLPPNVAPNAAGSPAHAHYVARALAEWMLVLGECHCFFERRKAEGVPNNCAVETPVLGVEVLRRP